MPEDSILAGMKPSALGNVGRSLSNQLAEVDKLFTSDLSRRARHADGCINVAGVSKTGAPADEFAMANRICALVPTTAMAAITLPVRSRIGLPTQRQPISPSSSSMAQPIRLISAILLLQSLDRVIGFSLLGVRCSPPPALYGGGAPFKKCSAYWIAQAKLAYRDCAVFAAGVR